MTPEERAQIRAAILESEWGPVMLHLFAELERVEADRDRLRAALEDLLAPNESESITDGLIAHGEAMARARSALRGIRELGPNAAWSDVDFQVSRGLGGSYKEPE